MLRFPLKTPITFLSDGKFFIGRFIYAGNDVIKVVDLVERIMTPTGEVLYVDNIIGGVWHFDRSRISGFKALDINEIYEDERLYTEELITSYSDIVAESRRASFKLVKKVLKDTDGNKENLNGK